MIVLLYWAVPVAIFVLVGAMIWLIDRRPKSVESGVEEFSRRIQALSQSQDRRADKE
ncbi:MAG: hypothetical protein ACP5O0_06730 [Acidimicrobiales bacterium]